jgi:drug/metabolite transporter (DMT)-like permease
LLLTHFYNLARSSLSYLFIGLSFAALWSSASIAGKFGLQSTEPLTFFTIRFLLAGVLLLTAAHLVQRQRLPRAKEWLQVAIFGAFNTTLYLGIFIIALQHVAAGITSLAIALNPVLISIMSSLWMKRRVTASEWIGITLGLVGVATATFPLLQTSHATPWGLSLMALSMITYSMGSVYYSAINWSLARIAINGWQVFIGGLLLLPFAIGFHQGKSNFDLTFWLSLGWLIIPVSVFAVQLWLILLKQDAVKASLWLFLCPIFGLAMATIFLDEPFTGYTAAGTGFVLAALYIGQKK